MANERVAQPSGCTEESQIEFGGEKQMRLGQERV
jgi:hypothetical protein